MVYYSEKVGQRFVTPRTPLISVVCTLSPTRRVEFIRSNLNGLGDIQWLRLPSLKQSLR